MISNDFYRKDRCYCDEYWLIENFDAAMNDKEHTWICHHKKEITDNLSHSQLKEMNLLYHRPPEELIFVTRSEHALLHKVGRHDMSGKNNPMYGKKHSIESKNKMSNKAKKRIRKRDCHGRFL